MLLMWLFLWAFFAVPTLPALLVVPALRLTLRNAVVCSVTATFAFVGGLVAFDSLASVPVARAFAAAGNAVPAAAFALAAIGAGALATFLLDRIVPGAVADPDDPPFLSM